MLAPNALRRANATLPLAKSGAEAIASGTASATRAATICLGSEVIVHAANSFCPFCPSSMSVFQLRDFMFSHRSIVASLFVQFI